MDQPAFDESVALYTSLCKFLKMEISQTAQSFIATAQRKDGSNIRFEHVNCQPFTLLCNVPSGDYAFLITSSFYTHPWLIKTMSVEKLSHDDMPSLCLIYRFWQALPRYINAPGDKRTQPISEIPLRERNRPDSTYMVSLIAQLLAHFSYKAE